MTSRSTACGERSAPPTGSRIRPSYPPPAHAGARVISGEEAFRLYDSLGMPLDFMEDVAGQRNVGIDRESFDRAMQEQKDRARAASSLPTPLSPASGR